MVALAIAGCAALVACDRKPKTPPTPSVNAVPEGPTAATGGPPSGSYPAGIKPAPSGMAVAPSKQQGPAEGGAAVGGMAAGQAGGTPAQGGTPAATGGDRAAESRPR